jgi:hypothetical protein
MATGLSKEEVSLKRSSSFFYQAFSQISPLQKKIRSPGYWVTVTILSIIFGAWG